MIDKILINPKTGEPYKNVPPKVAAHILFITDCVSRDCRQARLACSKF